MMSENDKYVLRETKKGIELIYVSAGLRTIRGRAMKWKKAVVNHFISKYQIDVNNISYNVGSRISVLIRVLHKVNNKGIAFRIADIIYNMGIEEVTFWKINEKKNDAVNSFLVMYKNDLKYII